MRVLHVFDHSLPLHSGYSFRSRAILEHQRRLGWTTFQLTSDRQGMAKLTAERIGDLEFHRSPPVRTRVGRLPGGAAFNTIAGLTRTLQALVADKSPDLIHAHSPCLTGLAAMRLDSQFRRPLLYECRAFWEDAAVDHGTTSPGSIRYRITRALETRVFRRADAITTICGGLKDDIVSRGVAPDKVTVIPNSVDLDRFRTPSVEERKRLRYDLGLNGRFVLGFVGSFYSYEGLDVLVRSIDRIADSVPEAALLLVGGGPDDERLRALANECSTPVVFTGRVPQEDIARYYGAIDVCVYPRLSIRLTELTTPLKPLEAMAFGRPVVASDIGGHRELLRDRHTALLFDPRDPADLEQAVVSVHDDHDAAQVRVANGLQFVERERTWQRAVERYEPVYRRLIEQHRRA